MQEINLGEELIELGNQLREIGLKYNQEYITMTYLNGLVRINNSTELPKEKRIDLKMTEDVERENGKIKFITKWYANGTPILKIEEEGK